MPSSACFSAVPIVHFAALRFRTEWQEFERQNMLYNSNKENALEWLARRVKDRCASSTCLPVAVGSRRASSRLVMSLSSLWRV